MPKKTPYEQAVQMFVDNPKVTLARVAHKTGLPIKNVKFIRDNRGTPDEVFYKGFSEKQSSSLEDRLTLLKEAIDLTGNARHKDYGNPVTNHKHIALIFNAITGHNLTARDVALLHTCTKLSRGQVSPKKKDHYVDRMAYAGIEYECAMAEKN